MYGSVSEHHGYRLLVVAPDPDVLDSLVTPLGLAGYTVKSTGTGTEAIALLREHDFDLVIADVGGIPDVEELGRGRRLPAGERPPILCLIGCEGLDRLVPELGSAVEDYVTKPCRITELLARTQVLLRSRRPRRRETALCHRDLLLDDSVRRAWRGSRALELTAAEYRLLHYMVLNAGQVLTKDQLAWQIWGETRHTNAIERLISRLRQKVDADGPALIHTRRGFGYEL
ncbi:response regulator transcription factor [Actinoplanes sp. NPDC051494]|uniref:response regulator transcription factor n=1 Tax=Actinoplanes sp. NPDC051494 TaxID=3363907 RepID=UPI0037AE3283